MPRLPSLGEIDVGYAIRVLKELAELRSAVLGDLVHNRAIRRMYLSIGPSDKIPYDLEREFRVMKKRGLVEVTADRYKITEKGLEFLKVFGND